MPDIKDFLDLLYKYNISQVSKIYKTAIKFHVDIFEVLWIISKKSGNPHELFGIRI